MRHYKKGRKLGTDASHTAAIKKNLMVNLFANDRIKTTLERAKEIRGDVDRIITWAKRGDVHSRRLAIAKLGDKQLVAEIFSKVEQGMYRDRPGGYTRIYKMGKRRGDDAVIVLMELVQESVKFKKKASADDSDIKSGLKVEKKTRRSKKRADADDALAEDAAEEAILDEDAEAEEFQDDEIFEDETEGDETEDEEIEGDEALEEVTEDEEVEETAEGSETEEAPVAEESAEAEETLDEATEAEETKEATDAEDTAETTEVSAEDEPSK